jgi:hypothetical protein
MLIHSLPWRLRTADRRENGCERAAVKASGRQNSLKNLVFLFISQTSGYQAITHIQTKFEQTRLSAVTTSHARFVSFSGIIQEFSFIVMRRKSNRFVY